MRSQDYQIGQRAAPGGAGSGVVEGATVPKEAAFGVRRKGRWRWSVLGLIVLLAIESVISAFTYPFFSLALNAVDLPAWLVGLNASLAGAGIIFVGPLLPRLLSVIGPSRLTALLFALSLLCFGAIVAVDSLVVWFAARLVMGACFAALWAVNEIWLNGVVDDARRGRVLATAMVVYTGAQFVGPLLISVTGVAGSYPAVSAMLVLALAAGLALLIRDDGNIKAASKEEGHAGPDFREAIAENRALFTTALLIGLISATIQSLSPLFGLDSGLDVEGASQLVAVFGLGELAVVIAIGLLADQFDRGQLMRLSSIPTLLIAAALPFVSYDPSLFAMALFFAGGILGGIYTLGLIVIGQHYRGIALATVSTGFSIAYSLGAVLGTTPIGYLIDLVGSKVLIPSLGVSLVALGLVVLGWRKAQPVASLTRRDRTGAW